MTDFLVIGGGIVGASVGHFLAPHGKVTLLEMESAPGHHSTGRSAAIFTEYYGGPEVRALTAASRAFLADHAILGPRGLLAICPPGGEEIFETSLRDSFTCPTPAREITLDELHERCPLLRPGWASRAMHKPTVADIDVDALHQIFLRAIRATGGEVVTNAHVTSLTVRDGCWHTSTGHRAPIVVNAAGAWADHVATLAGARPCGLIPKRRTAFIVDGPAGVDISSWPMVYELTDTFYFRPESGRLLVSPVDATPSPPVDARPDDLDIALAIDRLREATTLDIRHVRHSWAGLRTSPADDIPVIGPDPVVPGFHWAAGLGGYGVQSSPAVGSLAAAIITGAAPTAPELSPARF